MPRVSTAQLQSFDFSGGLVTDLNPLTTQPNICTDELNFKLEANGTRRRRRGIDREANGLVVASSHTADTNYGMFVWKSPGGRYDKSVLVTKMGASIRLSYINQEPLFSTPAPYTFSLTAFKIPDATDADVANNPIQVASVAGRLLIVGKYIEYIVLEWDDDGDTFVISNASGKALFIRDFEGADDGLDVDERPTTLSQAHKYNLVNQGWPVDAIDDFFTEKGRYPSNADVYFRGKVEDPETNIESFNADQLEAQAFGSSRAPMGSILLPLFDTTYSEPGKSGAVIFNGTIDGSNHVTVTTENDHGLVVSQYVSLSGIYYFDPGDPEVPPLERPLFGSGIIIDVPAPNRFTVELEGTYTEEQKTTALFYTYTAGALTNPNGTIVYVRPTVTASYAGRAWFAGIEHSRYESSIFFSQIVESGDNINKCYQRNDPTSEHLSDVLDSDGGRLIMSEVSGVNRLLPFKDGLLVFARTGVWYIGPGEKGYFSPNSYYTSKITDIGCVSGTSVVDASDSVMFFGTDGIYAITYDFESRNIVARNLSTARINNLYKKIPASAKEQAIGMYDTAEQNVVWMYSPDGGPTKNRLLILSMRFGSFVPYEFHDGVMLLGATILPGEPSMEDGIRFLGGIDVSGTMNARILKFQEDTFEDFGSYGASYSGEVEAYLLTGVTSGQEFYFPKTGSYIITLFNKTETGFEESGGGLQLANPSGCTLQARWDWANNSASGKFSQSQQAYRFTRNYIPSGDGDPFEDGRPVVFTKNKIRGRGRSLQLKFSADTGKDCQILGWQMLLDVAMGR